MAKTKTAIHGQKKKDVTVTLTPEGIQKLDLRAKALGISRSELIERMARNHASLTPEQQMLGEMSSN